jgi:divalent metal cation (Fe/Co/Zn/Cd) transporter
MIKKLNMPAAKNRNWLRIALWLVGATMAYNLIETLVALFAGWAAGSIALVGFGLDSIIELTAASVLLWRLVEEKKGMRPEKIQRIDHRVHQFVGITFFLLALYVLVQAGWTLWHGKIAQESLVGIILAIASLIVMPLVAWGKIVAAKKIGSVALQAEAKETIACSYLSFVLLLGLSCNAWLGWWWADPAAALLMIPWLIKEGMEGLGGQECCE